MEQLYEAVATVDSCGLWDWGEQGQMRLTEAERKGNGDENTIRGKLGCRANYRGIVTVRKKFAIR